jgi:predicted DsbA family dithiol-disulfide isomerase
MVKLDILSDPICPWCFIGKARLDTALAARPDHPFAVEYHPFQLNPGMPRGGMDRRVYLEDKFGGKQAAAEVYAKIDTAAREAGLEIDWSAMARTPNTLDAHRLIHWAGLEGRQIAIVSALFRAYFLEGRDIGDPAVLIDTAAAAQLDRDMVARLLSSDADRSAILERDAHARARGVTGVPTHIVGQTHVVPGAQPAEFWCEVIDDVARQDMT